MIKKILISSLMILFLSSVAFAVEPIICYDGNGCDFRNSANPTGTEDCTCADCDGYPAYPDFHQECNYQTQTPDCMEGYFWCPSYVCLQECGRNFYGYVTAAGVGISDVHVVTTGIINFIPGVTPTRVFSTYTDSDGFYDLTVNGGAMYDLTFSKEYYESKTESGLVMTLYDDYPLNTSLSNEFAPCEADCTYMGSDICRKECDNATGTKRHPGCNFVDATAINVCHQRLKDMAVDYNETQKILCCGESGPFTQEFIQADVKIPDKYESVRTTRIAKFGGKPVKLIIDVYG